MSDAWVAIITGVISAAVSLIGIITANRKNTALISYRIAELEKKQDKHNNLIERVYKLEGQMTEAIHEITDLKKGA